MIAPGGVTRPVKPLFLFGRRSLVGRLLTYHQRNDRTRGRHDGGHQGRRR